MKNTRNGLLKMSHGKINILGDFICSEKISSDCYGIEMIDDDDRIIVNGDFIYSPANDSQLTAGVIEVKGDLEILKNFHAKGTHTVLLTGESEQNIEISGQCYFNILDIKNNKSVKYNSYVRATEIIKNDSKIVNYDNSLSDTKLDGDMTLDGDINLSSNTLDLNGHKLHVTGNFVHTGGVLTVNGGQLIVDGNYTLSDDQTGYSSNGIIVMNKNADKINVAKDFIINYDTNLCDYLCEGNITVGGNIKSIGSYPFVTHNNIKMILTCTNFTMTSNTYLEISSLEIANNNCQVTINSDIYVSKSLDVKNAIFSKEGNICLRDMDIVVGNNLNANVVYRGASIKKEFTFYGDLLVESNMSLYANIVAANITLNAGLNISGYNVLCKNNF